MPAKPVARNSSTFTVVWSTFSTASMKPALNRGCNERAPAPMYASARSCSGSSISDAGAPSSVTALESWIRPQRRHVDELEIDPNLDHALHAQYPEHLREAADVVVGEVQDRKSTRLNSSHMSISYAVFCLKKK